MFFYFKIFLAPKIPVFPFRSWTTSTRWSVRVAWVKSGPSPWRETKRSLHPNASARRPTTFCSNVSRMLWARGRVSDPIGWAYDASQSKQQCKTVKEKHVYYELLKGLQDIVSYLQHFLIPAKPWNKRNEAKNSKLYSKDIKFLSWLWFLTNPCWGLLCLVFLRSSKHVFMI